MIRKELATFVTKLAARRFHKAGSSFADPGFRPLRACIPPRMAAGAALSQRVIRPTIRALAERGHATEKVADWQQAQAAKRTAHTCPARWHAHPLRVSDNCERDIHIVLQAAADCMNRHREGSRQY